MQATLRWPEFFIDSIESMKFKRQQYSLPGVLFDPEIQ
jgi:hypothetical protein